MLIQWLITVLLAAIFCTPYFMIPELKTIAPFYGYLVGAVIVCTVLHGILVIYAKKLRSRLSSVKESELLLNSVWFRIDTKLHPWTDEQSNDLYIVEDIREGWVKVHPVRSKKGLALVGVTSPSKYARNTAGRTEYFTKEEFLQTFQFIEHNNT